MLTVEQRQELLQLISNQAGHIVALLQCRGSGIDKAVQLAQERDENSRRLINFINELTDWGPLA
ncbi:hypothetical protein ACFOYW_15310 [Gryllotalpicola reticulitermitis]|uniref:Uncharacterized protein n=1 Tax=Gryllotalpicola reticulitermitis TaxID=1184153 RepID=A0ABV8Q8T6_9MICO